MSKGFKVNDNTPEVLRAVSKMTFKTLEEFTAIAADITTDLAPVRRVRGGNHRSSITYDDKVFGGMRLYSQSNYGAYLEFGTSKMAARPHFSKGIKGAINQFKDESRWKT